jgi:ankyrin repeat protein
MNPPIPPFIPPTPSVQVSAEQKRKHRRLTLGICMGFFLVLLIVIRKPLLANLILQAADHGNALRVRLLLTIGADPNASFWYVPMDETPVMLAAERGSLPTVQVLLSHGADVNSIDEWGDTPLMGAVEGKNPAVVRALLAHGASMQEADGSEETPLTTARESHQTEIIRMLLAAGAR